SEFYDNPNVSGGGLYDIHLHDVDYACYLFGDVKKVYSVGYKNLKGAWNNLTSTITFKNGVHTAIEACQEMTEGYPFSMHCRMLGTKGTIEFSLIS
ncbi:MAG: Gfo/Idh/MocA family oxidoreductase, partial [Christensenellaceae bacterium]